MKLATSEDWKQIFTDATTRRQQSFWTLIVGIAGEEGNIDPVIVLSCILLADESADSTFEASEDKIESLKHRLVRLREVLTEMHPNDAHIFADVSSPDMIDTSKLDKAWFTTDNCSTARKLQRLAEETWNCLGQNCWNHLRNTWVNAMEKETNQYLTPIVRDSIDECDPKLCVKMLISAFCRAHDKSFSLSANYPKGFGEEFLEYMKEKHPTFCLYHVARCRGARMDMILEAAIPLYMNRRVCIEYLDYSLKMVGKRRDNILKINLWTLMSSSEMVAQTRFYGIMYLAFCIPMRWLAGKTHELGLYPEGKPPEEQ